MIDKQLVQAIYGQLKQAPHGEYDKVLEELELLGIKASRTDLEMLHPIVLSSNSLDEAVELATSVDDEKKEQLLEETKAKAKLEEERKKIAVAAEKAADVKKKRATERKKEAAARKKEGEQKKATEAKAVKVKLREEVKRNNIYEYISGYHVVHEKTAAGLEHEVNNWIKRGYVPFGGIGAAAFGISPVGGNSYIQAMVSFDYGK